jgi:hypothetical protein
VCRAHIGSASYVWATGHTVSGSLRDRVLAYEAQGLASLVVMLLSVTATASQNQTPASRNQASAKQEAAHANGTAPIIDTSKWKIYRNEKYGFEVRYPNTWKVHLGSGTGPDNVSLDGPFRGAERPSLHLALQPNQNPGNCSIEEWFAEELHALGAKPESTGHVTIGGQPAIFMENTNSFGKQRDTFTLFHGKDVLSLSYISTDEYDPSFTAILATFWVLK